jgi:dTDP-4-dehydrorhamnose 3,5-epimerase
MNFEVTQTDAVEGVKFITSDVFSDERGVVWSSYNREVQKELNLEFTHDKFSTSTNNVLRGIHGDPHTTKLVSCIHGEIQQVVVDLRPESQTFGNHISVILDPSMKQSIMIPKGCGNAFLCLTDDVIYHYKLSYGGAYKDVADQFTIAWDDPDLNIKWASETKPAVSERDVQGDSFASYFKQQ